MKKKFPVLKTDKEAEAFVATADLTQYDLSDMRPLQYEFQCRALPRPPLISCATRPRCGSG